MSSTSKSSQETQNSSYVPTQETTWCVIVSKVPAASDATSLYESIKHHYPNVERVSRRFDADGRPIAAIRVDFESDNDAMQIINKGNMFFNGQTYPARGYWPLICRRCQQEGHFAAQCPRKLLTEKRLLELFRIQQEQLENMMNSFDAEWDARLSELKASSTNNMEKLVPIFRDLNTVCQQFIQQNGQMQQQLNSIVSRTQDLQIKSNNQ